MKNYFCTVERFWEVCTVESGELLRTKRDPGESGLVFQYVFRWGFTMPHYFNILRLYVFTPFIANRQCHHFQGKCWLLLGLFSVKQLPAQMSQLQIVKDMSSGIFYDYFTSLPIINIVIVNFRLSLIRSLCKYGFNILFYSKDGIITWIVLTGYFQTIEWMYTPFHIKSTIDGVWSTKKHICKCRKETYFARWKEFKILIFSHKIAHPWIDG